MTLLDDFLSAVSLGAARLPCVFNPWGDGRGVDDHADWGCIGRLALLRAHMSAPEPMVLLVGEAPGYQGCRVSGVPFTSEALVLAGAVPRVSQAWAERGALGMSDRTVGPWREPSASIIWQALKQSKLADRVLLWNAFPWHPHDPGDSLTNRQPSMAERRAGEDALHLLLKHAPAATVIAVGGVAGGQLNRLGVRHVKIRHPAYGGAPEFRAGLGRQLGVVL